MSRIFSCAAPLPCQQAMKMLHAQYNTIQTIMVQKVQNKICKIYTMHLCIQNRVRMQIHKLHVARSMIEHMLHLQLRAVLYVWYNTCISTMHCNQVMTSTKATKNNSNTIKKNHVKINPNNSETLEEVISAPCGALLFANVHNIAFADANKHSCIHTAMAQAHCSSA